MGMTDKKCQQKIPCSMLNTFLLLCFFWLKQEVILNPTVSRYELTNLVASSNYIVKVDGESEGQYISVVSSAFSTGNHYILLCKDLFCL